MSLDLSLDQAYDVSNEKRSHHAKQTFHYRKWIETWSTLEILTALVESTDCKSSGTFFDDASSAWSSSTFRRLAKLKCGRTSSIKQSVWNLWELKSKLCRKNQNMWWYVAWFSITKVTRFNDNRFFSPLATENESLPCHFSYVLALLSHIVFNSIPPCCVNMIVFDVTLSTIKRA